MPAAPPETIRQYRLEGKLGEGASGAVYRAFDTHLRRTVVVKLLHLAGRGGADDPTARLLEEARLASSIEHPNVCAVYEAGEVDGRPYLVMPYVPGRTLQDVLADGPLSGPLAVSLGVQIADGLAAAHRHGVLHRDLKPSNVMVTDEGLAKVLDFGLARRTAPGPDAPAVRARGRGDVVSSRFGTTAYMAPEQFATRRSTEQSDVWALGVVLYQMATGRHPFWAPSMDEGRLAAAIQSTTAPDPLAVRPDLDPAFASTIRKALARAPEARYRYAGEVRDALRTVARSVDGGGAGEAPVPPRPRRRAPSGAGCSRRSPAGSSPRGRRRRRRTRSPCSRSRTPAARPPRPTSGSPSPTPSRRGSPGPRPSSSARRGRSGRRATRRPTRSRPAASSRRRGC